ncbi:MAG: 3-isopropylmalate dehydratase, small subunit [Magnetococcales bacterium]|nr:3-isopropylmalate dehydratase, small subunit [Magnetococcales bacterium]HIJ83798.1 3-isopropylmalate dehydratase small subunit [Magnetococcales bacterium]
MEPFRVVNALVAPMDRANVDTDAIIPKQFLKSIQRAGFGPNLFDEWRYMDRGEPGKSCQGRPVNPDFILNQARYQGAGILLARDNFGCGSSREHAPWALLDFGFRVIIAPSFADIFFNNCFKNGILPVILDGQTVEELFQETVATPGYRLTVDLESSVVITPKGRRLDFTIGPFQKHCLLNGLDDIGLTLEHEDEIKKFEVKQRQSRPWVFIPDDGDRLRLV